MWFVSNIIHIWLFDYRLGQLSCCMFPTTVYDIDPWVMLLEILGVIMALSSSKLTWDHLQFRLQYFCIVSVEGGGHLPYVLHHWAHFCCELIRIFCPNATWVCVCQELWTSFTDKHKLSVEFGRYVFVLRQETEHNNWRWWLEWDRKPKKAWRLTRGYSLMYLRGLCPISEIA